MLVEKIEDTIQASFFHVRQYICKRFRLTKS